MPSLKTLILLAIVTLSTFAHATSDICAKDLSNLFPPIEPYATGRLKVSGIHELYYEEAGNPNGKPILFVHGGPGAGFSPNDRRFFDPSHYRIILFDQRGAGQSTPHAELNENTTPDLISDIEKLRSHLGIDRWILFGGSWGSTLSLLYAEAHPERVRGLILRGIFLCRKSEINWFYQSGAHQIYPEAWQEYLKPIPENERHDMVSAYYRRLTGSDAGVSLEASRAWSIWEGSASYLNPPPADEIAADYGENKFALAFARVEAHYFYNGIFYQNDNQILDNISKIRQIPTQIVHGRYDIVCPVKNAYDLKRAFPEATLNIVEAGHASSEPKTRSELLRMTEWFKNLPD